ncbi:MAG: tyrosine-protein kinase family protein [Thermoplasmata archaeon]
MRINLLSVKGGVGKSTLTMALAKALALKNKNVLLIDRDLTGYLSSMMGIEGKGLLERFMDNIDYVSDIYKEIKVENSIIGILKLYGGLSEKDVLKFMSVTETELEKLEIIYKYFLLNRSFDYYILDNAPYITNESIIVKNETKLFRDIFPDMENVRVYVSNFSMSSVNTTEQYAIKVESEYKIGKALGVIINMVPSIPNELDRAREVAEKLCSRINARISIVIPVLESLINFTGSIQDLALPPEITRLADILISGVQDKQTIINSNSLVNVKNLAMVNGVVLVEGPPGLGKLNIAKSIVKEASNNGRDIIFFKTSEMFSIKKDENVEVYEVTLMPKYSELRFTANSILDILKLSKNISTELIKNIASKYKECKSPVIIIYNANNLNPVSSCCDINALREEFWNTFLNQILHNEKNALILLFCDDISEDCKVLKSLANYTVEISDIESLKYKIYNGAI